MRKLTRSIFVWGLSAFFLIVIALLVPFIVADFNRSTKVLRELGRKEKGYMSTADVKNKVLKFCEQNNIACGEPVAARVDSAGFLQTLFDGREYDKIHAINNRADMTGAFMACRIQTPYSQEVEKPYAYFFVSGTSKEVEIYANEGVHFAIYKKSFSRERSEVRWPRFMSKEKAVRLTDSIAGNLRLPGDMKFQRIVPSEYQGVWSAVWVRESGGYPYEGDAVTINIMGGTGEFIGYTKTYRGTSCTVDVRITKENALELGWKKLEETLGWSLRGRSREFYLARPALKVINNRSFDYNSLGVLTKIPGSRPAWVIHYFFKPGVDPRLGFNNPPSFQIRIDAETGQIYYISEVSWIRRVLDKITPTWN